MVLMCQPVFDAVEALHSDAQVSPLRVMLTPQGERLTQSVVSELACAPWIVLICGHYEGFDERIRVGLAVREISIGDYVLSGGEPAAMVLIDAVVRLWIAHGGSMKALLGAHYESQAGEDVSELGRRLQSGMTNWRKRLEGLVAHALKLGQLRTDTDPGQFVFEIFGLMLGYLYDTRITQDPRHQARALSAYYRTRSTYVSFGGGGL